MTDNVQKLVISQVFTKINALQGFVKTSQPAPARNMKGTVSKFDRDVGPLHDDGISEVEQYRSALCTLHT